MRPERKIGRPLASGVVVLAVLTGAWALPGRGLGQGAGEASSDLLKAAPFDRITLVDGSVVDVEPISPRPLPPYDAKKDRPKRKTKDGKDEPPAEGNISLPGQESKFKSAEEKKEEERRNEVIIHTLEGDVRDFRVRRADIKGVEYFEDLLLAEADRLRRKGDYPRAFETLQVVRRRDPRWRGLDEQVNRLLFEEGAAALRDSEGDRGLRLLGELHARKPDYPGLADKLATAFGARIAAAFEAGAYARGRQILHDLERLTPDHEAVREAKGRFLARARGLANLAAKQSGGDRLDSLSEALRTWPTLEGAAAQYTEAFTALPTLDVAVADLPKSIAPWVRSPACERAARLVYLPVLAAESEAAARGDLPGQLAAGLEKANLGRRLELRLRPGVAWSDGSRPVGAQDVVRSLADRTDPRSPGFDARWADLLERVEATDEGRVEIRLARAPLRPEAWLLGPIGPAHAAWDGWVTTPRGRQPVGSGPFVWEAATADLVRYRARSEDGTPAPAKIRRVREVRIPNAQAALDALIRGDVTLVERVAPDRVATLAKDPEIRLGRHEQPGAHVIAIDGRNPTLRNRSLRRGLSYAIDRRTLLEEKVLKRPPDEANAVADGAFIKGSYGDAPGVKPFGYDPLLAKMLLAAAKKEMGGGALKLALEYPAIPAAQAAVPTIVEAWRKVDVEIEAIERPESELEEALRSGRRFDLAYRAVRCVEPVSDAGPLLCPPYDAAPRTDGLAAMASPRILELLLQLERAPDLPSARGLVVAIDRESRDELPVLPLWQLQDHFAYRARLKGPPEVSAHLYQGIDGWEIEPWFARDPW